MRLQSFFDISLAPDKAAFRRRLIDFAHAMDFPLVNGVLITRHDGREDWVHVGNAPKDFSQATDPALMARDPVLAQLRKIAVPFMYDQKFYCNAGVPEIWEVGAPWGYRTGISVNLRVSDTAQFLLGLDRERTLPRNEEKVARLFADLQLLAVHCQDVAQRLLQPQAAAPGLPSLTPREHEVLQWAKEGKSAWATGQLLNMSEHTVNFHLRNMFKKLGTSNKQVAVLKAISLGLIKP